MAGIDSITHQAAANARPVTDPANGDDIDNDASAGSSATGGASATGDSAALQITLSVEAQEFIAGDEAADEAEDEADDESGTGPGKSAQSPAHRARDALDSEEFATLRDLPFGRIVSTLARFGDLTSLLPLPEPAGATEESGETGDSGEAGETGETDETGGGTIAALPDNPSLDEPVVTDASLDDAALALQLLQDTADTLNQ